MFFKDLSEKGQHLNPKRPPKFLLIAGNVIVENQPCTLPLPCTKESEICHLLITSTVADYWAGSKFHVKNC